MAGEFLLDAAPRLLTLPAARPAPLPEWATRPVPPPRAPLRAALRHLLAWLMNAPQLQRDLREVENELRLARNRLLHYQTLGEELLARDAQRVVEGHAQLRATLTATIQALPRQ